MYNYITVSKFENKKKSIETKYRKKHIGTYFVSGEDFSYQLGK